jgi:hypothetical protein
MCAYHGRFRENGILTLNPTAMKTWAAWCETPLPSVTKCFEEPRVVDIQDYIGPPPAEAYFNLAHGRYGRDVILPDDCRYGGTICVDSFRPPLLMPSEITNLDSAWSTCVVTNPVVWDPPLIVQPTLSLPSASITIKSPEETIPLPGQALSSPYSAATPTPQANFGVQPQPEPLRGDAPILISIGVAKTIPASPLPDAFGAVFDGHTIQAGGPAFTTEGATITVGADGVMKVIRTPTKTAAYQMPSKPAEEIGGDSMPETPGLTTVIDRNGRTMIGGKIVSIDQAGRTKLIDVSSITGKITFVDSNGHSGTADRSQLAGKTMSVDRIGQTHMIDSSSRPRKISSVNENADSDSDEPFPTDKNGSIPKSGQFHEGPTTETFALGQGHRRKKNGGVAMLDMTCRAHLVWMVVGLVVLL